MQNQALKQRFSALSTPLIADACVRLEVPLRVAEPGIDAVVPCGHVAGRVLPVRHYGSVDIFLEAMANAVAGDILVIDNEGRGDEGCIGDLTVLEAQVSGLAGLIVYGCHRDTAELIRIGVPVFSYGRYPAGPSRLDPRPADALLSANCGSFQVTRADVVFADADGALFTPREQVARIIQTAHSIWQTERKQADAIRSGTTLRQQLRFEAYLQQRDREPAFTFRDHLRKIGGAIEE